MYDLEGAPVPLRSILNNIAKGTWKDLCQQIRTEKNKELKDALKAKASCFTVSGTFSPTRTDGNLEKNSGIGCIDIDIPIPREKVQEIYKEEPHILGYFQSISGNWALLINLQVEENTALEHKELMRGYIKYFEGKYPDYKIDPTCVNVSRLRYISYDPELTFEPEATTPWTERLSQEVAAPITPQGSVSQLPDEIAYRKVLTKYQNSASNFGLSGSRHEWILGLCVWCNRAGIDKAFVYDKLMNYPIPERDWKKEHRRTLDHVYKNVAEWGTHLQPEFYEPDDIRKYPNHKAQMLKWFIERKIKYYEERAGENDPKKAKFLESLAWDLQFLTEYYNNTYESNSR